MVFSEILILLLTFNAVVAELSCKDENGKDVDWFVAIKIPNLSEYPKFKSADPLIVRGQAYFYADSNNPEFILSKKSIADPTSAIGATVTQAIEAVNSKVQDQFYMFYNDKPPNLEYLWKKAHAKGLMNFNTKQGFWLVHSAPNFNDPRAGKYTYPGTSMKYGQSFLCATFLSDQLTQISKQIFVSEFGIYEKNLPPEMAKKYPRLYHTLVMEKTVEVGQCPYSRNSALKTKAGKYMMSYQKSPLAKNDLYANQVAEDRKSSLFVETWLRDHGNWKNQCGKIFVKNIRSLNFKKHDINWDSLDDHSKWAITEKPGMLCIGDINRSKGQANRGGGTLCLPDKKIWQFFNDAIEKLQCCPDQKGDCVAMPADAVDTPTSAQTPKKA